MSGPKRSRLPVTSALASYEEPKYARARTVGTKTTFVEQLGKKLPTEWEQFEKAHAAEQLAKSPTTTKARELAQDRLVKAARKEMPDQLSVLETTLDNLLNVPPKTGRLAVKYRIVKAIVTHARTCVAEVFRDLAGGDTELARLGKRTLAKIQATVGVAGAKWDDLGIYLSSNLKKIAEHAKLLRERLERLENLEPGSPEYEAVLDEIATVGGTRWSIRGMLFEIYIASWPRWRRRADLHRLRAMAIAKELGPDWEVITQHGDMHLVGKDSESFKLGWDMAILIVNRKSKVVKVHTTVQVKAEKDVTAINQVIDDFEREHLGEMSMRIAGESEVFRIEKLPEGHHTNRYVFFAGGGKLSKADEARLVGAGLRAVVIEGDLHLKALDAATFQIMFAMEKLYNLLVATGRL